MRREASRLDRSPTDGTHWEITNKKKSEGQPSPKIRETLSLADDILGQYRRPGYYRFSAARRDNRVDCWRPTTEHNWRRGGCDNWVQLAPARSAGAADDDACDACDVPIACTLHPLTIAHESGICFSPLQNIARWLIKLANDLSRIPLHFGWNFLKKPPHLTFTPLPLAHSKLSTTQIIQINRQRDEDEPHYSSWLTIVSYEWLLMIPMWWFKRKSFRSNGEK